PCFRDQSFAGLAKWEGNGSWPRHEAVRFRQPVRACSSSVERRPPKPRQRGVDSFLARHFDLDVRNGNRAARNEAGSTLVTIWRRTHPYGQVRRATLAARYLILPRWRR